MKLINIVFAGGLGNQLFQYANARALMENNDLLFFTTNHYIDHYLDRKFAILQYNVKGKVLSGKAFKKVFTPHTKLNRLINKMGLFEYITEAGFFIHQKLIEKCRFFTTISGFWQSATYFSSIRKELLMEIVPFNIPHFPAFMKHSNTVAIHIRRTDYLKDDRYGFLGENYYRKALNIIRQKINNPVFIFFSDDILWCKEVFGESSLFFCEDVDWQADYLQLYLMSKCSHQVIANSSFSWWGAWLNQNVNKIVIRPNQPFKDALLYYENYYPEDWIAT